MGIGPFRRSSSGVSAPAPNPNPDKYEIITVKEEGNVVMIELKYEDCTTYEGRKLLVYYGVTVADLWKQGSLDPHFTDRADVISPVARLRPNALGWILAESLADDLNGMMSDDNK